MRAFNDPTDPDQDELAGFIDRELRRLPELEAPAELGERILRQVRARAALPWWRRSFWDWPFTVRLPVSILFVTVTVAMVWGLSTVSLAALVQGVQMRFQDISPAWQQVAGWISQATHLYQHGDLSLWMWGGAMGGTVLFLMVIGAMTALLRLSAPRMRAL